MAVQPRLSRRLVLEELQRTPDGGGGEFASWVSMGTLWADIRPSSARETHSSARTASRVTHKITVRNAPEGAFRRPAADQRFRLGGRVFDIRGVADMPDHDGFLACWCEEGPYT